MAPGVNIAIVEKRFGAEPLFVDLRLEIEAGQVVALLGRSGVGKSSLLRLVAGIDSDFAGTISIGGVSAADAPMPGFVFQDARLLPWLSALDNVLLADPGLGVAAAQALLDQVGLAGRGRDFPAQLSGGMQRRVALARALAANPKLLLLDEPFVSLDAGTAGEMRALLGRLIAGRRSSVVLVTHDVEDAARLADRAVVLAGRPARIVADIALPVPQAERDAAQAAAYRDRLEALAER